MMNAKAEQTEETSQPAEVVEFRSSDGLVSLRVAFERDNVWLMQAQIAELFRANQGNVSRHLRNATKSGEITADSIYVNSTYVGADGKLRPVLVYNLDAIISVGYRVKSQRGTEFRIWATRVLRERLLGRTPQPDYARMHARVDRLEQLLEKLLTAPPSNTNTAADAIVTDVQYDALTVAIRRQALLEVLAGDWPEKPMNARRAAQVAAGTRRRVRAPIERACAGIRVHLAAALPWGMKGKSWRMLPVAKLPEVNAVLRGREADVIRKLGGKRAMRTVLAEHEGRQLGLFETDTGKKREPEEEN